MKADDIRVLVACEESQRVCTAFRERGFRAYSCDILPCSGGHPEWHHRGDVRDVLYGDWDLVIAHPPCTYLAVCGNKWFNREKYGEKAVLRENSREEAVDFFMLFTRIPCKHVAIENPIGIMSTRYGQPDQIIQPWMFGDSFSKKTCLWLKNLPNLLPTNIVDSGEIITYKSGNRMPAWYGKLWGNPGERSKTFPGIAAAMAEQWGNYLLKEMSV